jgi:hypothetical protein
MTAGAAAAIAARVLKKRILKEFRGFCCFLDKSVWLQAGSTGAKLEKKRLML